jgi:SSS family solute:Na+ symporter
MQNLPFIDLAVIALYMLAMIGIGFYFSRRNKNSEHFTKASGRIPGWAIGLSIYATFLSSNTFRKPEKHLVELNALSSASMPLALWWH